SGQKSMSQFDREKALFLYSRALDRGDFETVALLLEQAEQDAPLAQMIADLNDYQGNRSILPIDRPSERATAQGEKKMQVIGSFERPLPHRPPLSLLAAVAAILIVGVVLIPQLRLPQGSTPRAGAAQSPTPTLIPTEVTLPTATIIPQPLPAQA